MAHDRLPADILSKTERLAERWGLKEFPYPGYIPQVEAWINTWTKFRALDGKGKVNIDYYGMKIQKQRYKTVAGVKVDQDGNGNLDVETYEEDLVFNQYQFQVIIWDEQMKFLEAEKKPFVDKIKEYEKEIVSIDSYIDVREVEHDQTEQRVLAAQENYNSLKIEYDTGFGTLFQEGDTQERALRAALEAAARNIPGLPDENQFLYGANYYDIDETPRVTRWYPDIRILQRAYESRIKHIQTTGIDPIQYKIDASSAWLMKAQADLKAYEAYLRSP